MNLTIRPATIQDAIELGDKMRDSDRVEIEAASGRTAEEAAISSVAASSHVWAAYVDEHLMCVFGAAALSVLSGRGAVWMLGTPLVEQFPLAFLRHSRKCVADMLSVYPLLENYVHEDNVASRAWLTWLGFEFAPEAVQMPNGAQFRHFQMQRPHGRVH